MINWSDEVPEVVDLMFVRYLMGAKGVAWYDSVDNLVRWRRRGLEVKLSAEHRYGSYTRKVTNEQYYFRPGVAFVMVGAQFAARLHRWKCVIDGSGSSLYPQDCWSAVALMNASVSKAILESLNPTISFTVGDINRLPVREIEQVNVIGRQLEDAFSEHERYREASVEFRHPGASPWRGAQAWAQVSVDRPAGAPLPPFQPKYDQEPPTDHVSFAFGVALGRFSANGEGILDSTKADLSQSLSAGILFLDCTLDAGDTRDSLGQRATAPLHDAWAKYGPAIDTGRTSLREWLAVEFFKDVHKGIYETRPIYWPLSSADKTFVAWVNIHRFTEQTLRILLADHLNPTLNRIEGELADLRVARDGADRRAAREAEKRYPKALSAKEELQGFIVDVEQCADRGAPPADTQGTFREQDSRYRPDLDDGVMINSAALWPLLEPQWKDPKKWWKQLSEAKGKKDYDWSHLAMRYWPNRVDGKCQRDPSLGVAHGCFWRYHPERAWAWELRLQDEIGSDFRIEEIPYQPGGRDLGDEGSGPHRSAWLRDHAQEALAAVEREAVRRMGRRTNRQLLSEMRILEEGLWSALPEDVWEMELRLSERQGAGFRLVAPDEPAARAAYEAAYPGRAKSRTELIASLVPPANWFGETDDEDEDVPDDEETEDADADADAEAES